MEIEIDKLRTNDKNFHIFFVLFVNFKEKKKKCNPFLNY